LSTIFLQKLCSFLKKMDEQKLVRPFKEEKI